MALTSKYSVIRNNVISQCTPCSAADLQQVITKFEDRIKSKRTASYITNVEQLVRTLEKRCVLNDHDISCLFEILCTLNKPYDCVINNPPIASTGSISNVQTTVLNFSVKTIKEQVYDLLMNGIGSKWKMFARNLKISENNVDGLEERYRASPSERIREILRYYEEMHGENWYPLLDALVKSRHADLQIQLLQILSINKN